jgi:hypothetical protein
MASNSHMYFKKRRQHGKRLDFGSVIRNRDPKECPQEPLIQAL